MDDDELQAIRSARMAELRSQQSGSAGPSSGLSGLNFGGAGAAGGGGGYGGATGAAGQQGGQNDEQREREEEAKRQMLSAILDSEARERLTRIGLVKPAKSRAIQDLIVRMAQSGQLRGKVTEDQLIGLLDQIDRQQGGGSTGASNEGKITFTRKKASLSDDEDDFDL